MPHEKIMKYIRKTRKKHMKGGVGPSSRTQRLGKEEPPPAKLLRTISNNSSQGAAAVDEVSNSNSERKPKNPRRVSNMGPSSVPMLQREVTNRPDLNGNCVCLKDETLKSIVDSVSANVGMILDRKLHGATIVTPEPEPTLLDRIYDLYRDTNTINIGKLNNLLREYTRDNRLYPLFAFMCENLGILYTCNAFDSLVERGNYTFPIDPTVLPMTAREEPELSQILSLGPRIQPHIPVGMTDYEFFNQFGNGPNQKIREYLAAKKKLDELHAKLRLVYYEIVPLTVAVIVSDRVANIMRMKTKLRYVNLDFIGLNLRIYSVYELKYLELALENLLQIEFIFMACYTENMRVQPSSPLSFLIRAYLHCLLCIVPFFTGNEYSIPLVTDTTLQLNMMVLSLFLKQLNLNNLTALFNEFLFEYPVIEVELNAAYDIVVPAAGVIQPNVVIGLQNRINDILLKRITELKSIPPPTSMDTNDPTIVERRNPLPVKYGFTTVDNVTEYVLIPAAPGAAAPGAADPLSDDDLL